MPWLGAVGASGVGTRAAGFVLTLEPTQGRWSGDRYVLRQVPEETGRAPPL
jgi:hypothetical protein